MKMFRGMLVAAALCATPAMADPWVRCAPHDGYCYVDGQAEVAYGANNKFARKVVNGRVWCSDKVFGDPIFGVVKACYVRESDHAGITANPPKWTNCAADYGSCLFRGTRPVMYGKGNTFKWRLATNGIKCVPESFGGDPLPGVQKNCFYDANNWRE